MPDKITSKNLGYDKTLPPFLARLRGQQTSNSEFADPILAARRRSAKVRSASEEAEDAPVVVDEDGNVVQLGAGQLSAENNQDSTTQTDDSRDRERGSKDSDGKQDEIVPEKNKVAGIGATKKRKVGKIIGGGDDDDNDNDRASDAAIARAVHATQKLVGGSIKGEQKLPASKPGDKGNKKKAKKIKLSFGDDES